MSSWALSTTLRSEPRPGTVVHKLMNLPGSRQIIYPLPSRWVGSSTYTNLTPTRHQPNRAFPLEMEQLRIYFPDSQKDPAKSAVASRDCIRQRSTVFATAAELPADCSSVEFLATSHHNCKALEHYFE
ncbi:hypothetical protein WJX74_007369 [Apatococcus lobatus]|uniref:Uncharacterized protein n=1 Tax=Apatococcus lobatus TaxID=904363 RepID=A0AAW1SBA3_9CHLO